MEIESVQGVEEYNIKLEPICSEIERLIQAGKETILIGIDGMCASGKSTLGEYLQKKLDCNLYHMDDFFLQQHQRTKERLEEVGGNVDYERFKDEVIEPILSGVPVIYRPYRCNVGKLQEAVEILPKRIQVIEGAYCHHPYFEKIRNLNGYRQNNCNKENLKECLEYEIFDIRIFLCTSSDIQKERILNRNGSAMLERFIEEWIPKEEEYFKKYQIEERSIVIHNR